MAPLPFQPVQHLIGHERVFWLSKMFVENLRDKISRAIFPVLYLSVMYLWHFEFFSGDSVNAWVFRQCPILTYCQAGLPSCNMYIKVCFTIGSAGFERTQGLVLWVCFASLRCAEFLTWHAPDFYFCITLIFLSSMVKYNVFFEFENLSRLFSVCGNSLYHVLSLFWKRVQEAHI